VLATVLYAGSATGASAQQVAGVNVNTLDIWNSSSPPGGYAYLQLEYAAILGAREVRTAIRWNQLEPNAQGAYDPAYLSEIDQVVGWANSLGIKPLFVVLGTPCWASSAPAAITQGCADTSAGDGYPPTDDRYFAEAMSLLAQRYGANVAGWEIWNEPNLGYFWNSSDPAGDYVKLIQAAYPAIKQVSSAPVLGGAVSLSDYDFVNALYADGIEGNFDALSIHPYSFNDSPLTPGTLSYYGGPASSFSDGVPAVHDVMLRHGDSRQMWLTEFGWPTSSNGVDPATQATYVSEAYTQMQAWPYVQAGFYYELQDSGTDPADSQQNYGLLRNDGSQKPSAAAFQQMATATTVSASSPAPSHTTIAAAPARTTGSAAPSQPPGGVPTAGASVTSGSARHPPRLPRHAAD